MCELCSTPIPPDHGHVVDTERRSLGCACRACALLFTNPAAAKGRWRTVPDRYQALDPSVMDEARWDALAVPVGMAFFFTNGRSGSTVAFYPSPAGATESLLALDAWAELAGSDPVLATLAPDVEALLVRRLGPDRFGCYLVPIDACYQLVGLVRSTWRGFDGGEDAKAAIDAFFADVDGRCSVTARRLARGAARL